ncbi:putative aquaporin NIP7-1 isoform X1 [Apium graveolens]|uniref:putative aquaporin NIP7-1 isoform X1 n=1 Tax=Apium graveolens TaxID=4045 RepID=UPI003D78BE0D
MPKSVVKHYPLISPPRILMTKQLVDNDNTCPNLSNDASSSGESKYDQESGCNSSLRDTDRVLKRNAFFSCTLPFGIDPTLARIIVAEALGSFILVFCICGIVAITQIMHGQVGLLEYAVTAALTVTVVVFSIGAISGAHINPAVTIAFAASGPFPWSKVPLYIVAQIVGSVAAAFVGKLVYGIKAELMMTRPIQGYVSAFFVELIVTFIILFVTCAIINESQTVGPVAGIVAGVAIGLGVLITGPVSGASMNPARSLAPAIISWNFDDIWIYILAPTIGAVMGALCYRVLCLHCRVNYRIAASPAATLPTNLSP